ncbi:MAG: hypothetical protein KatS3mg051_1002 [Anaerolineae bacterium]|nr:MAG: hypothetical protein KatS3mg051_1002 [Anaerolineae bacterium]
MLGARGLTELTDRTRTMRQTRWAWIVPALLALAALACSVRVTTAHFENVRLYREPDRASTAARAFDSDETIYCLADLKKAEGASAVRADWILLPEQTPGALQVIASQAHEAEDGLVVFAATPPPGGWPPGSYRVELYVDDYRTATLDFVIRGRTTK